VKLLGTSDLVRNKFCTILHYFKPVLCWYS